MLGQRQSRMQQQFPQRTPLSQQHPESLPKGHQKVRVKLSLRLKPRAQLRVMGMAMIKVKVKAKAIMIQRVHRQRRMRAQRLKLPCHACSSQKEHVIGAKTVLFRTKQGGAVSPKELLFHQLQ